MRHDADPNRVSDCCPYLTRLSLSGAPGVFGSPAEHPRQPAEGGTGARRRLPTRSPTRWCPGSVCCRAVPTAPSSTGRSPPRRAVSRETTDACGQHLWIIRAGPPSPTMVRIDAAWPAPGSRRRGGAPGIMPAVSKRRDSRPVYNRPGQGRRPPDDTSAPEPPRSPSPVGRAPQQRPDHFWDPLRVVSRETCRPLLGVVDRFLPSCRDIHDGGPWQNRQGQLG